MATHQGEPRFSIGEIARQSGFKPSTIRYYERIGLVAPPERRGGQRRYEPSAVTVLAAIRAAKEAGFSLSEIKDLFRGFDRRVSPSERWARLADNKLRQLDELAAQIEAMRALLRRGLECGCLRLEDCQLLDTRSGR